MINFSRLFESVSNQHFRIDEDTKKIIELKENVFSNKDITSEPD